MSGNLAWSTAHWMACLSFVAACSGSGSNDGDACSSNRDCTDGRACVNHRCEATRNASCESDEACATGEYCDPVSGRCVERTIISCTTDDVCPLDQRCNTLTGVCVDGRRPCGEDGACPKPLYCSATLEKCVACLDHSQCTGGGDCIDGECTTKPRTDAGASHGGRCGSDTECDAPATICETGRCVAGCAAGGSTCGDGKLCDSTTGRCVTVHGPCTTDGECSPPQTVCEERQCVAGCNASGGVQCRGGQSCNATSGRCETRGDVCSSDLDCNAPATICNLLSGVCEGGCGTTGCRAPDTCDAATGHCGGTATCAPDRFEPNEASTTASTPGFGLQPLLTACAGSDDWYAVDLVQGDAFRATATFVHGEGNIDLELVDGTGTIVAASRSSDDDEEIQLAIPTSGRYVLRVFLVRDLGPKPGADYSLELSNAAAPCATDAYEPNDSLRQRSPIATGTFTSLTVCRGNDDYYEVTVAEGQELRVDVVFRHAEGDVDAWILGPGIFGWTVAESISEDDDEHLTYVAESSGALRILVSLARDTGAINGNPYTMTVTMSSPQPQPTCTDDALEQNDDRTNARIVSAGAVSDLAACLGDDDFFGSALATGDVISVDVQFSTAEGDIDLELFDPNGTQVAHSSGVSGTESVQFTATSVGTHVARAFLYRDAGSTPGCPYALAVDITRASPQPTTCADDVFEENDSTATSTPLATSAAIQSSSACPNDDDYFALGLSAGQTINIDVLFANNEGDIDVTLVDELGDAFAYSVSTDDDEHIEYAVATSGTYFVRVHLYEDRGSTSGNAYRIDAQ